MSENTITLKRIGFRCEGTAKLNLWGGGQGCIEMDSWDTTKGSRKEIAKGVNDGQFGCEFIESAEVMIYTLYENNVTIYEDTITFSAEELEEAKKGI